MRTFGGIEMPTPAGKGEHRVYKIVLADNPGKPALTPRKHYLGVDAVAWYINRESSFFADRMASGTLQITLSSGLEQYQAALGTFELKGGSKTAPVFQQPVLPDRNFLGGPIMLNASLTAIKKDNVLGSLLKSAANASLGIVAGMVQTASLTGPAKLLSAAGDELVSGVKKILSDTAPKREPLFDFSGLQYSLKPGELVGDQIYLLLHRGAPLDESALTVKNTGQLELPYLGGNVVDDGAWLLLKLRRGDVFSGVREWFTQTRALRSEIDALVADVAAGVIPKVEALKQFNLSTSGSTTLYDKFAKLRTVIQNDGVLTELEAGTFVGELSGSLAAAKAAISKTSGETFNLSLAQFHNDLVAGEKPTGPVADAFVDGLFSVTNARRGKKKPLILNNWKLLTELSRPESTVTLLSVKNRLKSGAV
jgi:hypothetical protein